MIPITHVITGLEAGGAQTLLARLLPHLRDAGYAPDVVSLLPGGAVAELLRDAGVPVRTLGMSPTLPSPAAVLRLARWLRRDGTRVVQTWLYHADLVGGLAARAAALPVVWGVHTTSLDPALVKRRTRWVAHACARLSAQLPAAIVCCSQSARDAHAALGYATDRLRVIPNGVDADLFRPDKAARTELRRELGLDDDVPLVGLVARFHPAKDHATFFAAAARLASRAGSTGCTHFVLAGEGMTTDNATLAAHIASHGLGPRTHLLGYRRDIAPLLAGLDLATLSSVSEASPMVLAEAMSCGVPCVSTDTGDAREMLGATGLVVAPRDPDALANAWHTLLDEPLEARSHRGAEARTRAGERFSLAATARRYAALYDAVGDRTL